MASDRTDKIASSERPAADEEVKQYVRSLEENIKKQQKHIEDQEENLRKQQKYIESLEENIKKQQEYIDVQGANQKKQQEYIDVQGVNQKKQQEYIHHLESEKVNFLETLRKTEKDLQEQQTYIEFKERQTKDMEEKYRELNEEWFAEKNKVADLKKLVAKQQEKLLEQAKYINNVRSSMLGKLFFKS